MNTVRVRGYTRPAMLGGPIDARPDVLTIRWYGTSNFELNFRDRVVLLDNFYDRGPRMRDIGFRPDEVVRADALLIGHPHYDHIGDTARVSKQTGAPVVVHPLGADVLVQMGLRSDRINPVLGMGEGEQLEMPDFTLRVIHGFHADLLHPEQGKGLRALAEARAVWESDKPPLSEEELAYAQEVQKRGSWAPEVFTEGTMCMVLQIGDFVVVYRDSAGPVSAEESAYFRAHPGCDLAIVGFVGRPLVRRQLDEATMPLVNCYQPRIVVPCHHDDLYPGFIDMPTEPMQMRIEDVLPETSTIRPVYVEPIHIDMRRRRVIYPGE
jgi:L-ascorbate metabolism protein UlaG (beta-lactamase superfamily)